MSDDVVESPIPWGLVEHVHRTKSGRTTMQISLPIELRARMAQAAIDLGCSKLTLIRSAISQFLLAHEEARSSGQGRAFLATSEVIPPVAGHEPVEPVSVTVPEPVVMEPEPVMELEPEPMPEPATVTIPLRKRTSKKS